MVTIEGRIQGTRVLGHPIQLLVIGPLVLSENEFLNWLQSSTTNAQTVVGIGDDAAISKLPSGSQLVSCTDTVLDGVHFDSTTTELDRIGHKAIAVNLSDIAAMGAIPTSALIALTVPRSFSSKQVEQLLGAITTTAAKYSVDVIGGDTTSWDHPLAISVTVLGELQSDPWLRSGAEPGDLLFVTGPLGGSILGKHLDFQPRFDIVDRLQGKPLVNAAIDISDGLALDLQRLAQASRIKARIEASSIPISEAARELSQADGTSPLDHALSDGEDFELLLAITPSGYKTLKTDPELLQDLIFIGECHAGEGVEICSEAGVWSTLSPAGYEHRWAD